MPYRRRTRSNYVVMTIVCIVGLIAGGYLGIYISQLEMFTWAGITLEIGTENPWVFISELLETSVLFRIRFNPGSIFGLFFAFTLYKLIRRP